MKTINYFAAVLLIAAGMMPIALGLGADASFRQPMAVAVIGGLITSTLLSLIVIPAAFAAMETFTRRFTSKKSPARPDDAPGLPVSRQ